MTDAERLNAIEEIGLVKARYFRGVDAADPELVRSVLAEDCALDYRGCCTDPTSGVDYLPAMNIVMNGRASWSEGLKRIGIVSVHHGHMGEIEITSATTARAIWAMEDRLYMPPGAPYAVMIGYGHYHETYENIAGAWKIKTLRISRLRVESA